MKVKRCTTDEKSRNLRNTGGDRNGERLGRSTNLPELTFRRRKRKSGKAEIPGTRRLKELKKRNRELKHMLAGSLLKKRVLKIVNTEKQ